MRTACTLALFVVTFGSAALAEPAMPRQWIVVTTEPLRPAIEPLIERRREQGWRVDEIVLPAGEVDDAAHEPAAIRRRIEDRLDRFDGTSVVLLAGDYTAEGIASFAGSHGRMTAKPTDHGYGLPDEKEAVTIAVGRLPARNVDEARALVAKTLALEDRRPESGTNRVHLMIGDPGAKTKLEERFARAIVRNTAETRLAVLHPMWRPVCIADTPGSRFSVDSETFETSARQLLGGGHVLAGYAGHSGAAGWWSPANEKYNVPREVFEALDHGSAPGVFVSCGCWGCQIEGDDGEGYLLAAIRNPKGPAAGIGAFGESYAAFGQFALDGVVNLFGGDDPPRTLGDYWLAAQNGLVRGEMSTIQFWLYDRADGSGGTVPMSAQRLEHAEMWTLLGDPGLRLPFVRPALPITVTGEPRPEGTLAITVDLPADMRTMGRTVRVVVEPRQLRWTDVAPTREGERVPGVLASQDASIDNGRATAEVTLPAELPEGDLVVRATLVGASGVFGVATMPAAEESGE